MLSASPHRGSEQAQGRGRPRYKTSSCCLGVSLDSNTSYIERNIRILVSKENAFTAFEPNGLAVNEYLVFRPDPGLQVCCSNQSPLLPKVVEALACKYPVLEPTSGGAVD
jgi:hypothetical protein